MLHVFHLKLISGGQPCLDDFFLPQTDGISLLTHLLNLLTCAVAGEHRVPLVTIGAFKIECQGSANVWLLILFDIAFT